MAEHWTDKFFAFANTSRGAIVLSSAFLIATAAAEAWMGRSWFGPDGKLGLWEGNIWSSECSQRLADAYSFSHITHGILFYGILWLVARKSPMPVRFYLAMLLEAGWEVLENSPVIINRYRQETMALGYDGDSIVNSLSDVLMMIMGFVFARSFRPWVSFALVAVMEIGCLLWIRDNLTLNIIMLIAPIQAVKKWQMAPAGGI